MSRQQQLYTGGEVTDDEKMYTRWVKMYLFQLEVSPRVCILTIGDSVLDDQRLKWKPCNAFFLLERNSQLIQNATLFFISALSFMTQPCKRGRLFPVSQRICTPHRFGLPGPPSSTQEKFWVPVRNRTSELGILRFDALPLSQRNSMVSKAITKFVYDTCPAYCMDQQCRQCHIWIS